MSLPIHIRDGSGNGNYAKVGDEGEQYVIVHPHPPKDETFQSLPYTQYFTDDGTSAGSSDMAVNGSGNSQLFYISANNGYDIYIKTLQVQLGGTGTVTLNKFSDVAALSNGLRLDYVSNETGEIEIENIKTNLEFLKLATGKDDFGTGTDVFRADVSGAGENTYLPEIDLSLRFGLPWGIRIRKSSTSKLAFSVRDDLSTIATFNIKAYGIRI